MLRITRNYLLFFIILVTISLDQYTKTFLIDFLKSEPGMVYKVSSYLSLVFAWNHGISFGLFSNYYQYSNYVLLGINFLITIYLLWLLYTSQSNFMRYGLAFVIGGAFGNIFDRIYRGAVFDFIYFHYEEHGFAVFNLADSFINIGVFLIIISFIKKA